MRDELPDFSRLPEDSAKNLYRFSVGGFVLLVALLFVTVVYSLGEALEGFQWRLLRNGLLGFFAILIAIGTLVFLTSLIARNLSSFWITTIRGRSERRQLDRAAAAASEAISEKQRLSENRARLTAQLQAAYLFEKESSPAANARAAKEFREALQCGVMRSCQIAFDHISNVIDQYEKVVAEIEASILPDSEKSKLLNSLTRRLDVVATEQRNVHAEKMMEAEIWKVRFRKAKLIAKEKPESAIKYLNSIQGEARTSHMKTKVQDLINTLAGDKS